MIYLVTVQKKDCCCSMVRLETWVSLGSLGMSVMFIVLMISFYLFLLGPDKRGPGVYVDPEGVLIQIISISGAPGLILACIVFGFQKTYDTMHAALILIAVGAILIGGMSIVAMIARKITSYYIVTGIDTVPYIFIIAGVGVTFIGAYLFNKSKGYPRNLEDEIH